MPRLVLSLVLWVALGVAALAEPRVVYSPGDGFLNLRTGPGSGYQIVLEMDHGSIVDILEVSGKWARVRHRSSGAQGWAFAKYLHQFDDGSAIRMVQSPGDGYLNLRTGPGSNFDIIRPMYHGDTAEILERSGKWVRVRHHQSGAVGWAFEKYLRR